MEFLPPECGGEKRHSVVEGILVMAVQLVAEVLSLTLLLEAKSSERLKHDTPVLSLCRSGGPDFGGHIKN